MDISVVIPLYNEEESLRELHDWIQRVMTEHNFTYEIIFVNDGSTDGSWNVIEELSKKNPCVKGIKFRRNYGKSPALYCGFKAAQGNVVITMDADLQDSPDEIPELYRMITEEGYDLVSGWKKKRYDPLSKTIPTKLFNATARKISGVHNLHDFNCGLKAYRSEVVKNIEVYGEMHRYIPYLAKNAGFDKIGEKVVHHQARKYGHSKFGINQLLQRLSRPADALVPLPLRQETDARLRISRLYNVLHQLLALLIMGIEKVVDLSNGVYGPLADSAWFFIFLTGMLMGLQLFLAGFLGDLISRTSPQRNDYQIEKLLRIEK